MDRGCECEEKGGVQLRWWLYREEMDRRCECEEKGGVQLGG